MANSKQAEKRIRQNEKSRQNNKWQVTRMRTAIKNVRTNIELKDYDKSMETYRLATSIIDRMQSKGKVHKNTAARLKSRLNKAIKALVVAA
ncbi:30S ribosomal protein S20 [bacterium]|nr:30S ribosomal protein S20 [bacterium]NBX71522.1 30S ribosomal protein S20 [bacterium]